MKREHGLDWLRFFALLAVMGLHVSSSVWSEMEVGTGRWLLATLLRQTWAVPVLVMITGALLLAPDREPKIKGRLFRILRVYLPWTAVYQLYYFVLRGFSDWKGALAGLLTGAYHMWYLWMLAGLYLLTPLLRPIGKDRRLCERFLALHFALSCLTYFGPKLPLVGTALGQAAELLHLDFGYVGLYLLGRYLHRWPPKGKWLWLGAAVYGISVLGNLFVSWKTGVNSEYFTNYLCPTMMAAAGAVFLAFQPIRRKFPEALSRLSLQAYLAHALVNEAVVAMFTKEQLLGDPLWMLPATALVAAGSFGLAWILEGGKRWRSTL